MSLPQSTPAKTGVLAPAVKYEKRGFHGLSVRATDWLNVSRPRQDERRRPRISPVQLRPRPSFRGGEYGHRGGQECISLAFPWPGAKRCLFRWGPSPKPNGVASGERRGTTQSGAYGRQRYLLPCGRHCRRGYHPCRCLPAGFDPRITSAGGTRGSGSPLVLNLPGDGPPNSVAVSGTYPAI